MDAYCDTWTGHSVTAANVDLRIANNGTWMDAFQFGYPDDTTWTLVGQSFKLDVQLDRYDTTSLLSISTALGSIIVDDVIQRVIHFNVTPAAIQTALSPGTYVYDLVMVDGLNNVVPLMYGTLQVIQGVTYPPT
jgi:hypothetical protein